MQTVKKVGIFDSGAGGLSVLKSLLCELSFEYIVYYGDTARVPYGNKDSLTIQRFSLEALEFFTQFELDLLIVACNTASAHALTSMQAHASIPVVGVIESGIEALRQKHIPKEKHILVIATSATIESKSYENNLQRLGYTNVTSIATNLLVGLVEENIYSGEVANSVFRYYFPETLKPDVVILGCTHFPLLLESLERFFGDGVLFIHSGEAIVSFLRSNFLVQDNASNTMNPIAFFASDKVEKLKNTARQWLNKETYRLLD